MNTQYKPTRLLLETLALVALAQTAVLLVLPVLAPGWGPLGNGLLELALLVLLVGPAVYWRFVTAYKAARDAANPTPTQAGFKAPSHAFALTAATQLFGLLLTAGFAGWQHHNLLRQEQSRFAQGVERIESEVLRRMNQIEYDLKSARSAMESNPQLDRAAFRSYVASRTAAKAFTGVRGLGLLQPERWVVRYAEPLAQIGADLGLDMGQDPVRRDAIESAVHSGEATLLAGVVHKATPGTPDMLYLLPVYRAGSNPQTPEERARALLGVLYAPLVTSELLESVASAAALDEHPMDFALYEGRQTDPVQLVFRTSAAVASARSETVANRFADTRLLLLGSRVFTLHTRVGAQVAATQDRSSLGLMAAGGTLVSFLMALSVWLLAAGRQQARNLAQRRTAELARMAQVVQHTNNAVAIMDRDLRIEWVNQGFSRITGYALEEALGKTPGELLSCDRTQPEALRILEDAIGRGQACRVDIMNRGKDGHEYWADTEVQPLFNPEGELEGFMEIGTDVSAQKKAQLQLETAMRDARALLHTLEMHAIVSATDARGLITEVNDAFCRISGYGREELIGQNHRILQSGVQNAAFWSGLWRTISSGQPWRGEICNRAKDGSLYWVDSMIAPFVGDDGRIQKYISIRTDITESHASAERLRQSEATFAAAFQDAATGMALLSPKGRWLMVNPAMCEFLGMSPDELHGTTLMDTSHPEEWDTDRAQMERLLAGEIPIYQRAKRYLHRDGYAVWGLASVSVVRKDDGQPEFVIAQVVDITARKRAEEALARSNALMEESQAVAKVGGWELNLLKDSLYWTREIYTIHETTPDDFYPTIEASLDCFVPGSREPIRAALQAAKDSGQGFDLELQALTTRGRHIDVRTTGAATWEAGRVVRLSGIFQDITERKQFERSLTEERERAELATRSKGQFLANMSHEIRTPMNAILGMLKLLHNTDLNSRQRDYADKTENAAKSLLSLINDILDFSKVEAGKMQLDPQPFRVNRLMRSLSVILSSNLGPKSLEMLFDIDPQIPDVLLGDSMRLQQVLINLGGNAVKFTKEGQVVVSLQLKGLAGDCADVEFAVQDSGIGIAPEHQAHIFTGFSQAEASTTRKFGGTGLGLAISKRMVELMGGELGLSSTPGVGSRFAFTLRMPLVAQVPPELEEALPPSAELRRALVVDSNAVARGLLARMVQSWGWPTEVADSGEAALERIAERLEEGVFPFDVVYLDWHMSGMDGWTTAARLRALCAAAGARQPVLVMLSGNIRDTLEQRTQQEQALLHSFLVKPVTASMLLEAALESSASRARIRQSRRAGANQRRLTGMRVLVVEDNLINQQVAEELLAAEGALVALAANGQLGVDAISAAAAAGQQFDVVLMDIQMPVLDGFAATRVVRQELGLQKLPIVAMTANALSSDRDDCLAGGMNAHVGKPFDIKALVQTLLDITGYQAPASAGQSDASLPQAYADFPDCSLLDVVAALGRMGGQTSLYLRSAKDFVRTLPQVLADLHSPAAFEATHCGILAHSLKSTSALLGALDLAEIAGYLEKQCKTNATGPVRTGTLDRLGLLARGTVTQLQQVIAHLEKQSPAAAAPAPDHSALQAALEPLQAQLAADDLGALETFATHRQTLAALPEAVFDALEQALQDLDLALALALCQGLGEHSEASAIPS